MMSPQKVILTILSLAATLAACTQRYGSVGHDSVYEALNARAMAVTPCVPGWLLAPSQIHRLKDTETRQLRLILNRGEVRKVHEKYYRDPSQGNRGDNTTSIFYLYASNGQCLGGRVIGNKVYMDDFNLQEEDCAALYSLLRPHLQQVFNIVP